MRKIVFGITLLLFSTAPLLAQQSVNYKLEEHTFNNGGNPDDGVILTSGSYKMTLDAIGDTVAASLTLSGTSFNSEAGFVEAYPPPGEVITLNWSDKTTLNWTPEKSVGSYCLYRGFLSNLSGLGYGNCHQQDITGSTTTDNQVPATGTGYFYLVTARNRISEEGIKGYDAGSTERSGTFCP